ncbi:hypothetical protein B6N60_01400 [Richelia sinica FACHB-800]|uniref:Uncharacterized protein n=1 Tax=Richelia sinica FACHB-800 TaxID=1357546 RepID=A0A975T5W9_9NOST|nr:hypothetical protein B6N60_01400 [Richelia sinica FACHB-800]
MQPTKSAKTNLKPICSQSSAVKSIGPMIKFLTDMKGNFDPIAGYIQTNCDKSIEF